MNVYVCVATTCIRMHINYCHLIYIASNNELTKITNLSTLYYALKLFYYCYVAKDDSKVASYLDLWCQNFVPSSSSLASYIYEAAWNSCNSSSE